MDPRSVAKHYVRQLVSEPPGLKALLLDEETIRIVSLVYSQSELLAREVVFIDKLKHTSKDNNHNGNQSSLKHLTAVIFVRPTAENVHALRTELRHPKFPSYRLFFSNTIKRTLVEEIAYADAHERVSHIGEIFADFYPLGPHLVSFGVLPCVSSSSITSSTSTTTINNPRIERTVDAIASIVLALKLRSPHVRFQSSSSLCRNIAQRLAVRFDQERSLFDFRAQQQQQQQQYEQSKNSSPPIVLLIDRREDPVTPLLNQWTYEAMVHELLGIQYNRVSLIDDKNKNHNTTTTSTLPSQLEEVVLDDMDDIFFAKNRYVNFGDLGANLQTLVQSFQSSHGQSSKNVDSIQGMMKFVESYPEIRRESANVSKHVAVTGELSKRVGQMQLLQVSELEQDIACRESEADHRSQILRLIHSNQGVTPSDKLRLVMLYALRYEGRNDKSLQKLCQALSSSDGITTQGIHLVSAVKQYAGNAKRSGDLFNNRSFFAVASNTVRRGIIGGVENVYTQHEPLLAYTLENLFRGRLKNSDYPLVRPDESTTTSILPTTSITNNNHTTTNTSSSLTNPLHRHSSNHISNTRATTSSASIIPTTGTDSSTILPPTQLIIVMAGGTTYEEAKCISAINAGLGSFVPPEGSVTASAAQAARQLNARVVLAGTCVHNSTSFAVEISHNAHADEQQHHQEHFVKPSR